MSFSKVTGIIATVILVISVLIKVAFAGYTMYSASQPYKPAKEPAKTKEADGQIVNFLRESYALGDDGDNNYYALVGTMQMGTVAIKKRGTAPVVKYYIAPEGSAPNNYLVSKKLKQEDLSKLITDEFKAENESFCESRDDYTFTVIDLDKDVKKTADDFRDDVSSGIMSLVGIAALYLLSSLGIVVAVVLYIISFIALLCTG